ncbi:ferritin-like domain-containing protein [Nocardioides sp. AE5]|uniref:ferritin-like domain-containing protein n=1 Tax=Nocardioides sp. AE5 TaxID=2962573 RepID=UPI0028828119|nr:ferritin-like domain-containing protein [Nocardioides sp. AE5]MDT0201129.1 ferritin-like domain-containing protein [Nocardioides sp. AE5]
MSIEALQTTLAAEHAAVWIHGVLGGQVSRSSQEALAAAITGAYTVHRGRRDQVIRWIRDLDQDPVAAEVAYELTHDVATPAGIQATAQSVEQGCARAYADLVGRSSDHLRTWAISALVDAAKREMAFGGTARVLPGIPD